MTPDLDRVGDLAQRLQDAYLARMAREGRMQTYEYTVVGETEPVWFNVSLAQTLVDLGYASAPVVIDAEELAHIAARNEWDATRVSTADPSQPGIAAPLVILPPHVPRPTVIYILIDGTHRAVKAHQDGTPFSAVLLRDAAAELCVLSGPPHLFPWHHRVPPEVETPTQDGPVKI